MHACPKFRDLLSQSFPTMWWQRREGEEKRQEVALTALQSVARPLGGKKTKGLPLWVRAWDLKQDVARLTLGGVG